MQKFSNNLNDSGQLFGLRNGYLDLDLRLLRELVNIEDLNVLSSFNHTSLPILLFAAGFQNSSNRIQQKYQII